MEYYDLSAASFADRIEVGRSSISHLLSGRNKPSLDFVMKIIQAFPEVELYWLLNGKGSFPANKKQQEPEPPQEQQDLFSNKKNSSVDKPEISTVERKQISRIVIFYKDGSFEAFEN